MKKGMKDWIEEEVEELKTESVGEVGGWIGGKLDWWEVEWKDESVGDWMDGRKGWKIGRMG